MLFALPTYAFVTSIFMLSPPASTMRAGTGARRPSFHIRSTGGIGALTLFIVLRAFASGSTALTGVEAIANGVNAFRRPTDATPRQDFAILGTIAIAMFVGVSWLAVQMHATPTTDGTPSVLAEIARGVFPAGRRVGFMYWAVQILTLAVLVLAANTSYQGFPRLAALLAREGSSPGSSSTSATGSSSRTGSSCSTAIACALLWVYDASVDSLIHLYVIGVFTAFTLSQLGMVRYWLRTETRVASRIAINTGRSVGDRPGHR